MSKKIDGLPPGVVVQVVISISEQGAMSISGPVHDRQWMLACLHNAIDAINNHHQPKKEIIIPEKDVCLYG